MSTISMGGAGDDTLLGGEGDILTGGSGSDAFLMDTQGTAQATIMDFDAEQDTLALIYEDVGDTPEIAISQTDTQGDTIQILVNGIAVVTVHGGSGLTPEDIVLIPQTAA